MLKPKIDPEIKQLANLFGDLLFITSFKCTKPIVRSSYTEIKRRRLWHKQNIYIHIFVHLGGNTLVEHAKILSTNNTRPMSHPKIRFGCVVSLDRDAMRAAHSLGPCVRTHNIYRHPGKNAVRIPDAYPRGSLALLLCCYVVRCCTVVFAYTTHFRLCFISENDMVRLWTHEPPHPIPVTLSKLHF